MIITSKMGNNPFHLMMQRNKINFRGLNLYDGLEFFSQFYYELSLLWTWTLAMVPNLYHSPPPPKKNGAHILKWMNKAISAVLASQLVKMFEKPHLTFWAAISYIKTLSLIQRLICGECSYTILKKKKKLN